MKEKLVNMLPQKNKCIIEDHVKGISTLEGGFNAPKMWNVKRKIFSKGNMNRTYKERRIVSNKYFIVR